MMSGTTEEKEEATVPDIVFRGTDGNECEAFIVAIQDFAFAKGSDEDHHWMLRFARTRLRGRALRWYAKLDSSIKKDWELLVQALFEQYPLVTEPGDAEIATPVWSAATFSPAPSTVAVPPNPSTDRNVTAQNPSVSPPRPYDASSTGQQIGLLRIVNEQEANTPQYIFWNDNLRANNAYTLAMTTTNRHEALVVSFLPSPAPHTIGCLSSRAGFKTLAVWWRSSASAPEPEYYYLYNYSKNSPGITPSMNQSGYITKLWNLLADGTLKASLTGFSQKSAKGAFEEIKYSTTEVHVDTSGDNIRLVKPGALLEQDKPERNPVHPFVRARIVFEPL